LRLRYRGLSAILYTFNPESTRNNPAFNPYSMTTLKPCGHRLEDKHFTKIRQLARKWKVKDALALRKIIEAA
jgi:hypothetical protein